MRKRFQRKLDKRKQYSFIYIFTEGEKTEPIYFEFKKKEVEEQIRKKLIKIKINKKHTNKKHKEKYKGGYNTISLVDFALKFIKKEKINLSKDECWVVFDKDDFDKNFDNAIKKAKAGGLAVAYSNEAFELWFLLHFNFMNSAIGRKDYNRKIKENYIRETGDKKYRYNKSSAVLPLIGLIRNREQDAIRNAKKLLQQFKNEKSFIKKNPSTTAYLLVERLNKLKK